MKETAKDAQKEDRTSQSLDQRGRARTQGALKSEDACVRGREGDETDRRRGAAARTGVVAMGWDLLCPRCRGAKSRVSRLHELPKGVPCSLCNIDYERNFSRNVEFVEKVAAWRSPALAW